MGKKSKYDQANPSIGCRIEARYIARARRILKNVGVETYTLTDIMRGCVLLVIKGMGEEGDIEAPITQAEQNVVNSYFAAPGNKMQIQNKLAQLGEDDFAKMKGLIVGEDGLIDREEMVSHFAEEAKRVLAEKGGQPQRETPRPSDVQFIEGGPMIVDVGDSESEGEDQLDLGRLINS